MKYTRKYFTPILLGLFMCTSCAKFIKVDPPNSRVVSDVVYQDENLAIAAVDGVYHRLFDFSGFASGGANSIALVAGLSADELQLYNQSADFQMFYENSIVANSNRNLNIWSSAFNTIYQCNAVLEGLDISDAVNEKLKRQLEGEVLFVRAFTYFNLANLYGGVPLILSTDYTVNALADRDTKEDCYRQIVTDLNRAIDLLEPSYRDEVRTHANRFAAEALLARVGLYMKDWSLAERMASEVIDSNSLYRILDDLDAVFLANSEEAIWQISPTGSTGNTYEGYTFIIIRVNWFLSPVALSDELLNAFELGDARLNHWIASVGEGGEKANYAFKYKIWSTIDVPTEYSTPMRLAEVYLIRAEARAQLGDISGAQEDVNVVRGRADLPETEANTLEELLAAVLQERRVELFTEQGHRWFDLIRMEKAEDVLIGKNGKWSETNERYPIPEQELAKNPNLTPNLGY